MKKIKVIVSLFVVLTLIVGVTIFLNKEDYSYYLVMGDYVSKKQVFNSEQVDSFSSLVGEYLVEKKVVNEVNDNYLKNNMTSKKLLEMIEKDTYAVDNSSLVDLIKKSKYISITLGINDLINQVKYDSKQDKIIYDKDIISNKIEIFKHNYHEILDQIQDLNNDAKVILVGCYPLYGDSEISLLINEATKDLASEFEAYYVDVSDISDTYMYQENELYLTSLGQEVISSKVIYVIKEIEEI